MHLNSLMTLRYHLFAFVYGLKLNVHYKHNGLELQKGTVVEKLVEETANNDQHLRHLISICEGNLN